MSETPRWTVALRVVLPLVFCLAFGLSVLPVQVTSGLSRAKTAETRGRPAEAGRAAASAAEMLPWRADLWEQAGLWSMAGADPDAAVRTLERAQALASLSGEAKASLAEAYRLTGRDVQAMQIREDLLQSGQADRTICDQLAAAYLDRRDWYQAGDTLRRCLARDPLDTDLRYRAGLALTLDAPREGMPLLLEVIREDPAYNQRVRAVQTGLNSADLEEEPAYRLVQAGRGYASAGEWAAAREVFLRAVEQRPDYAEAWALLGESLQQTGEDGSPELEKAARLDPQSLLVHALFSLYWQRQDEPGKALEHITANLALEPDNLTWQIELGNVYAAMGRLDAALQAYQRATEMSPDDPFAWQSLAAFSVLYQHDLAQVGLPAARKAVSLAPAEPAALDMMGQVLLNTGDLVSAERFFMRALEEDQHYPPTLLHLGILYLQDGRADSGLALLEQAAQFGEGTPAGDQAKHLIDTYPE